ncbi:MAG: helix-turn-helix domain-containing protein [Clostridiales bacterium]|nr:helix-turn-helix domain-containing protein [Clostridiales bacterium]
MKSNIRKLRKEHRLSQTELGEIIGVSQQIISRMERDRNRIEIDNLLSLADYFGVSTDYILAHRETGTDDTRPATRLSVPMEDMDSAKEIMELRRKVNDGGMDGLLGVLVDLKHYIAE